MQHQLYLLRRRKPKQRVYKKLPPEFASDYIKALRVLSRKHRDDDADEVTRAHRLLKVMSREALVTKRGELWIPSPDRRTGYYPIIEKVPYTAVRTMLRKNTSEKTRDRARGVVAASAEPFVPLFSRRPGTLNEAQRRSFLAHIMVALPWQKGRHPAFLGKRVPGELSAAETGTRSVIPIHRLAPEDWEKGFTMRKFALDDTTSKRRKWLRTLAIAGGAVGGLHLAGRATKLGRFTRRVQKLAKVPRKGSIPIPPPIRGGAAANIRSRFVPILLPPGISPKVGISMRRAVAHEVAHGTKLGGMDKRERLRVMLRALGLALQGKTAASDTLSATLAPKSLQQIVHGPFFKSQRRQLEKQMKRTGLWKEMGKAGYNLSEDLAKTLEKRATRKPRVTCPTPHPPQTNAKETLKRATELKVALEPEQSNYVLSVVDRMCYEDGFRTRMAELKQQAKRKAKRAWRWIRGEALPAVVRGATLGVAELAETELGMGPTTIDLQPVRRISLKPQYQPYPSSQLRSVVASLQERLVQESDPVLRKGLEKSVSELATELAVRSALL